MSNKKIILFKNKTECCGCGACKNICHKNAIFMTFDEYGYVYPNIDYKKCISCGLCKKVCAYQNENIVQTTHLAWAASSKDNEIIFNSASGGIFTEVARNFLEENGIVIGVSLEKINNKLIPKHIKINNINELKKIQGSKYVQSDMGNIYIEVRNELNKNNKVLFSGTPCQVAALKKFLGKEYKNLYTIDIICHGVPSIKIFQDYILSLEEELNGTIIDFKFRDKKFGWGLCGKVEYKKDNKIKEKILPSKMSSYYNLFLTSEIYRENCYSCKYANIKRVGDITLGDYWGIKEEHPEYFNGADRFIEKRGVSCIMINSQKGELLLNKVKKKLNLKKSTIEKISRHNEQLSKASKQGKYRELILNLYKKGGYKDIDIWYKKRLGIKWYLFLIWDKMPFKIKSIIKNLLR